MFDKKSTKGIYISFTILAAVLFVLFTIVVFSVAKYWKARFLLLLFGVLFVLWGLLLVFLIRKKLVYFSDSMSECLDDMISGKENIPFDLETETLMAKLQIKLKRLYEIMKNNNRKNINEKMVIQSLVSDISHQTKTPIANIKMYSNILQERSMSLEKQKEFLKSADIQINKLDFLMQSMIKMSRLETGVFEIAPQHVPIYDTLAEALGGILINAEKKNIYVTVDCEPSLIVNHDPKWTSEALFNILDNAVKYTHEDGKISVSVTPLEFYTNIDIKDNGKGISEKHQAEIFKRFYREADVHDQEGIGIGLYLAREIISMQNGYIQVKSKLQYGSTFSVFIPN